jgi:hypothetical protein
MAGNAHRGSNSLSGRELLLREYDSEGNDLWTWQSDRPIEVIATSGAVASDDTGVYLLEPNLVIPQLRFCGGLTSAAGNSGARPYRMPGLSARAPQASI